jgi:glutaredoxin
MIKLGEWWSRLKSRSPRQLIEVTIYSKPDCHLCDEAKAVLLEVQRQEPFILREVNIEEDAETREAFKEEIPVIFIAGRKAFKYRVGERELLKRLQRARRAG